MYGAPYFFIQYVGSEENNEDDPFKIAVISISNTKDRTAAGELHFPIKISRPVYLVLLSKACWHG